MQGIELRSDIPVKESELQLMLETAGKQMAKLGFSKWDIHYGFAWMRIQNYWFNRGL